VSWNEGEHLYRVGSDRFLKRWDDARGRFLLFKNDQPVSVAEWNQAVNRAHPMAQKSAHPNPLIRWVERQRFRITERLGDCPARRILDIGCESGQVTARRLGGSGLSLLADLDSGMLRENRRKNGSAAAIPAMAANVTRLPFRDGSLDLIFCTEVLEHLERPEEAVGELARVLAPGGRLVVSVPNDRWIVAIKTMLKRLGLRGFLGPLSDDLAMGHIQLFSAGTLRRLLQGPFEVRRLFLSFPFRLNFFAVGTKSTDKGAGR